MAGEAAFVSRYNSITTRGKLAQDPGNDLLHRVACVDEDWILVGIGLLQDCEVTIKVV